MTVWKRNRYGVPEMEMDEPETQPEVEIGGREWDDFFARNPDWSADYDGIEVWKLMEAIVTDRPDEWIKPLQVAAKESVIARFRQRAEKQELKAREYEDGEYEEGTHV